MNKLRMTCLTLITVSSLTACGGTGTNVNPMDLFDASNSQPALDAILPTAQTFSAVSSGFSANSPRWVFSSGSYNGVTVLAPAAGVVTEVGTTTLSGISVTYIRMMHTGLLSTIVYGVQLPSVRVSDSVLSGQVIGNFVNSGQVAFEVRSRDVPVCPLSYISPAFRSTVSTVYTQLCN
ncbi:MAG: peptidoglycan DD-metalloendopeptidase family protein [Bdellovibrionales bacterium]|nr:peptidoglycan DD-metalloendopeptidase family protein [Oligoflexia bacterium]